MQSKSEQLIYDDLPEIQSDEFLPPVSLWMTLGGLFLLGSCGIAVAVAAFTPYNVTVRSAAAVRPVGELRLVQATSQGVVKHIGVRENQTVEQGDIIATIDDFRLQTKKSQLQSSLTQNQKQLSQIDAQVIAINNQITSETNRIQRVIAAAEAELAQTERDYQERVATVQSQSQEAEANLSQAQQELQKASAQLRSAEAELRSTQAALSSAITKRDRYKPMYEQGAVSIDQYQEAELAVSQQQQALEAKKSAVEAQKLEIQRLSSAVDAARARLQGTLATLNPTDARVTMAREKIYQERATGESALSRLNQEREQLIQRQFELQNQLARDREELQQTKTEVDAMAIRALVPGIIQQLNLRNIEQVVNTGDVLAQIAPSDTALVIKALVPTQEIAKVEIGQQVQMRVSACPYPDYGTLLGTVSTISPDASSPQKNNGNQGERSNSKQENSSYNVTIQPEHLELSSQTQTCKIQSGMEGRADIITKEETVLTFILRKARLLTEF
jgi:HlyD family secretion protein